MVDGDRCWVIARDDVIGSMSLQSDLCQPDGHDSLSLFHNELSDIAVAYMEHSALR
jgi:hypothetical protein